MPNLLSISESPLLIFILAFVLRAVLFFYGIFQDSHSALKYTDIDYYVFTDAARAVSRDLSPYTRATYRYTPLLAWILVPTSWSGKDGLWFHSGKALFALSDIVAGGLIYRMLQHRGMQRNRALKYASVWLLNPMVANISTRGSSEGLLCALVVGILYAFQNRQVIIAGSLLGLAVHFKLYPFIYGISMFWALRDEKTTSMIDEFRSPQNLLSKSRIQLLISSLITFSGFNFLMYSIYGQPFAEHTFLYHFTRTDHRHNFSVYNALLYISSAVQGNKGQSNAISAERLAFIPQLTLCCVLLPLLSSRQSLPTTMLAQTLAFVAFNKVCTSQYFLWYLIFLPLYLPHSSMLKNSRLGLTALGAWIAGQAMWLGFGFRLEFLGKSAWLGLWSSSALFFAVNCWLIGVVVSDAGSMIQAKSIDVTSKTK